MPKIEIVTHCYSGDVVPIYHRLLCYQLSSLLLHRADVDVQVSVCREAFEPRTIKVLNYFQSAFHDPQYADGGELTLKDMPLPAAQLFRRAIGRNMAALESDADVVWFTDADHLFGRGCLDKAYQLGREWGQLANYNMIWPEMVWIHKTHDVGDECLAAFDAPEIRTIDPDQFQPRREKQAWGGLQIVHGDYCRRFGYLNGTKWQEPVDPAGGFKQCKGDPVFRRAVGKSCAVAIPNLFRMRHTRAGRDGGRKDHGEKTRAAT